LMRVYAMRKPWRSALRCEARPGAAHIASSPVPARSAGRRGGCMCRRNAARARRHWRRAILVLIGPTFSGSFRLG
jgi:hypothetical protein